MFNKKLKNKNNIIQSKGFTLAEVLITLVIIGVVAALTLNVIITNSHKQRLEVKIEHFYSMINQALKRSYVDNGEFAELPRTEYTYNDNINWLNRYIIPYISYMDIKNCNDPSQYRKNAVCIHLANGDLFEFAASGDGADILYFPEGEWQNIETNNHNPKRIFAFQFFKKNFSTPSLSDSTDHIEAYSFKWDGTKSMLYNDPERGCAKGKKKFYCTKILEQNGWKFPKDYPAN